MSDELKEYALQYFHQARREQLHTGIDDLLIIQQLIDAGHINTLEELQRVIKPVWGGSRMDFLLLDVIFQRTVAPRDVPDKQHPTDFTPPEPVGADMQPDERKPSETDPSSVPEQQPDNQPATFQSVPFPTTLLMNDLLHDDDADSGTYYPASSRFMSYMWRYLRTPLPSGPRNVFDIEATIHQTIKNGRFTGVIMKRQIISQSHLVLFVDRGGSMVPFHHYVDDIIATARAAPDLREVQVYYFRNIPHHRLTLDEYANETIDFDAALNQLSSNSYVLIISDAGSARYHNRHDMDAEELMINRVQQTLKSLHMIRQKSRRQVWLNPVPRSRWPHTAAGFLAPHVPMYPINQDGFRHAIDELRGIQAG